MNRLYRIFLAVESGLICQTEIWIGRKGAISLRKSWCPAVLTENFFMDNHSDLEYLQSRAGKQAVVDTHVEGIVEWLESKKS